MFGRWLTNRIQAVESALAAGRVDEAYRVATEPGVMREPSAARVLDELARVILARARLHAQGGRNIESLADIDRIAALHRVNDETAALRERLLAVLSGDRGARRARETAVGDVRRQLEAGDLTAAAETLRARVAADDPQYQPLELAIREQGAAADAALNEIRARIRSGDALGAARLLLGAPRLGPSAAACVRDTAELVRGALRDWFAQGRLDRFTGATNLLRDMARLDSSLDEFKSMVHLIQSAAAHLGHGDYASARSDLLRLGALGRDAAWVRDALGALDEIVAARDRLLASPLGLVEAGLQKSVGIGTPAAAARGDNARQIASVSPAGGADADPLLLLLDGTGSVMLTSRETIRIGRAGGGGGIDVPIPADLHSHHAEITRNGEDYFLVALGPVQINGRPVRRSLLRDGDRVVMGRGAKMVFCKPGDRCDSAVLVLGDRCRLPQDVERVVLFKDTCLVGPDPGCHVRTREGDCRLVLFRRGGGLCVRRRPLHDRGASREVEELPLGQTREIGDLRLTIKRYADGGARVV